jgi:uncharacterized protein (UPF0332 family)
MFVITTEKLINVLIVCNINIILSINKMGQKEALVVNVKNFINSAELVYLSKDYTSASILYFKALFSVLDFVILKSKGKTPKDHSERFRILELDFPEFYNLLDRLYPKYRDSYTITLSKEDCDGIRKNVRQIAKEQGILR